MMKKGLFLCVIAFLCLCAVLSGCTQENETYDVVCTIFPQYDFCKRIVGDEVNVKMLLPVGTDAHNYEATLSDVMAIKNCKLFVYVGGESESWVEDMMKSTDLTGVKSLELMSLVDLLPRMEEEHEEHEHEHGRNAEYDEHVYLSVKNAMVFTQKICDELCSIYPEKAEKFRENASLYISELAGLDAQYTEELSNATTRTMYFADRYPFAYLAKDYLLTCVTPYHGCSTDREITLKEKSDFRSAYEKSRAKGVFVLENGYEDLAENVTNSCGGKIFRVHSCQSLTQSEWEKDVRFADIMRNNLTVLKEALA